MRNPQAYDECVNTQKTFYVHFAHLELSLRGQQLLLIPREKEKWRPLFKNSRFAWKIGEIKIGSLFSSTNKNRA